MLKKIRPMVRMQVLDSLSVARFPKMAIRHTGFECHLPAKNGNKLSVGVSQEEDATVAMVSCI